MASARRAALAALVMVALAPAVPAAEVLARANGIVVEDGYAFAAGPAARTAAAYMRVVNEGAIDDRLIAARSPAAQRSELHLSEMADGVSRMRPVEGIAVPAGGSVLLETGGLHVMLMGLTAPLEDGGSVELTLVFEGAGEIPVTVQVDLDPAARGGHGH